MARAVAVLADEGVSVIKDAKCAAVTYPAFVENFQAAGADFALSEY